MVGMTQPTDGNPNQSAFPYRTEMLVSAICKDLRDNTVPHLTELILQTNQPIRDEYVLRLLDCQSRIEAPIGIVSMLVAASDRHQVAHRAMVNAKASMNRMVDVVESLSRIDHRQNIYNAMAQVMASARMYVIFLGDKEAPDEQRHAQILFGEMVQEAMDHMDTLEGRNAVRSLAWTAMSAAMAEQTERATRAGYRTIQNAIHMNFY
jgi:hypothetical protein